MPIALILLSNKIRAEAPDTFAYFARQGVTVRVISGDNPMTVSEVARRAGIPGAERWVDARTLRTDEDMDAAAEDTIVFGRVSPEQKRRLVQATQARRPHGGHDRRRRQRRAGAQGGRLLHRRGLRQRGGLPGQQIVLMDSNFASLPSVVGEGRRVINNIERSASLYLVKNIFSMALALLSLLFTLPYPLSPSQLGLVNVMTIGIPSFILAMEPSRSRVRGSFIKNILVRALPAALTDLFLVEGVTLFYLAAGLEDSALSTISAGHYGVVGLMKVYRTAKPMNKWHIAMLAGLSAGFAVCFFSCGFCSTSRRWTFSARWCWRCSRCWPGR
jgi:cation-transporting ATPase E